MLFMSGCSHHTTPIIYTTSIVTATFIHSMTDEDARFLSSLLLVCRFRDAFQARYHLLGRGEIMAEVGSKTGNEKRDIDMYCISCCRLHEAVCIAGIVNVKLKQAESQACGGVFHGFLARLWSLWHEHLFLSQSSFPGGPKSEIKRETVRDLSVRITMRC
jgi:hypothetical protein